MYIIIEDVKRNEVISDYVENGYFLEADMEKQSNFITLEFL